MLKFLVKFFLVCAVSFISFIAICVFCLYLAISREPFPLSLNSNSSIASIIGLKNSIETETKFIFLLKSKEEREVAFSSQEINSAFNLYVGANQLPFLIKKPVSSQKNDLELRGGSYENGAFILLLSKKMSFKTPLGDYLNFYVMAEPSIKDNNLKIVVHKCKIGSLPIPSFVVNYILKERNPEINNTKEVKLLVNAVEELDAQTDSVTIIYNPEKLSEVISKYTSKFRQ